MNSGVPGDGAGRGVLSRLRHAVSRYAPAGGITLRVAAAVLAAGAILRLWHILGGRSLWLDEAMLASSIVHSGWSRLLQPLSDVQVAPIGWLLIEKAAFEAFGGDFALRLPQLLAGLAALALFATASRRLLGSAGFLVSLALFALSPLLVRYSAEVKPYGVDVLVSVAMLIPSMRYLRKDAPLAGVDFLLLLILGVVAVSISLPAAFVLAGFGGALLLREIRARRWTTTLGLAAVCSVWLGAFAQLLLLMNQSESSNLGQMRAFWGDLFAPFPPTSADDLKWYYRATSGLLDYTFGLESKVAAGLAMLLGAWAIFRKHALLGVALSAPATLAMAASSLELYPFHGRMLLFALPHILILIGAGVDAAFGASRTPVMATSAAAAALLFGSIGALWGEFTNHPRPYGAEDMRPVLEQVSERRREDEAIYVNGAGMPAFRYYSARVGLDDAPIIEGRPMLGGTLGCLLADIEGVSRHPRVWVIHSHPESVAQRRLPEDWAFARLANAFGRRIDEIGSADVRAYLYEFDDDAASRLRELRRALSGLGECARQAPS